MVASLVPSIVILFVFVPTVIVLLNVPAVALIVPVTLKSPAGVNVKFPAFISKLLPSHRNERSPAPLLPFCNEKREVFGLIEDDTTPIKIPGRSYPIIPLPVWSPLNPTVPFCPIAK